MPREQRKQSEHTNSIQNADSFLGSYSNRQANKLRRHAVENAKHTMQRILNPCNSRCTKLGASNLLRNKPEKNPLLRNNQLATRQLREIFLSDWIRSNTSQRSRITTLQQRKRTTQVEHDFAQSARKPGKQAWNRASDTRRKNSKKSLLKSSPIKIQ
jgi:hypothetical protein